MPLDQDASVLLIHVTGPDRPGLTHALTSILGEHGVRVLDIGQAVIHDALALGILVAWTDAARHSPVLTNILLKAHELDLQVRFSTSSRVQYETWVNGQAQRRSIVTVLGPSILAEHLAAISGVLAGQGMNIERIDRLSARPALEAGNSGARACVEFTVSGSAATSEDHIRAAFMQLAQEHGIDIAFQHDNVYRRNRRLVAFDMDSTLIQVEVIDELAKVAGVGDRVARITEAAMRGELDFPSAFRERVRLLKGLPESALEEVAARIPLTEGAERLVSTLRSLGYKTAILSGGFTYFGRRLQAKLGIDYLYANELEVRDGAVTGEVTSEIVDGKVKARRLREIAEREKLSLEQVIAVGDGANDLPMIALAGLGIAFRAKPVVRKTAQQSISAMGLDGILYLIGLRDRDTAA
jgi:phosphoserine phosphatase